MLLFGQSSPVEAWCSWELCLHTGQAAVQRAFVNISIFEHILVQGLGLFTLCLFIYPAHVGVTQGLCRGLFCHPSSYLSGCRYQRLTA